MLHGFGIGQGRRRGRLVDRAQILDITHLRRQRQRSVVVVPSAVFDQLDHGGLIGKHLLGNPR